MPKLWGLGERFRGFEHWLEPSFASAAVEAAKEGAHDALHRMDPDGVSVAVAIIGICIARCLLSQAPEIPDAIERALQPAARLLYNK